MKKVTPKQATIIVKSGIEGLLRDLADKKIPNKANPMKNDIESAKRIANVYSYKLDFAKDAYGKLIHLGNAVAKGASADDVATACKKDWPDLSKSILG